jgi:RNA polymerase sigma factor (TIGR02999 family)
MASGMAGPVLFLNRKPATGQSKTSGRYNGFLFDSGSPGNFLREIAKLMNQDSSISVTQLLQDWRLGDHSALHKLIPLVYGELHRLAHKYMAREQSGHTLQTTALVNEAYVRLIDAQHVDWKDRSHFFAISANLMRRILVDFARSRNSDKRGSGNFHLELDAALEVLVNQNEDIVGLDNALTALADIDPRSAKVVELRFFGGLTIEEAAEVLSISDKTVMRDWKTAKVWLKRELKRGRRL